MDPTAWISYEVTLDVVIVDTSSYLPHQFLHLSLVDTEKTYSGLTDGCAKTGKASCKLIEFTGDSASGDDVKALLNYAHDVINFFPRLANQTDCLISWLSNFIATELQFPLLLAS